MPCNIGKSNLKTLALTCDGLKKASRFYPLLPRKTENHLLQKMKKKATELIRITESRGGGFAAYCEISGSFIRKEPSKAALIGWLLENVSVPASRPIERSEIAE